MLHGYSGSSNGHCRAGQQREGRPRRGRGGPGGGFRVSHHGQQFQEKNPVPPCTEYDKAYFQAYSDIGIHEEMIKDQVRTSTYRAAIMRYQDSIAGKVVMDVGCGTGILAIFCALAGARRVYAIDASDIAFQAIEIVKSNNLSDKIIVLHGRVEDVDIEEMVDVIISEWMGYLLLYETMLPSVIFARDKWLKPGGLIMPSHATLYMAPITHVARYRESIDFWRNVYGIDMTAMLSLAKQYAFEEPCVETISGENVMTWPSAVMRVDCNAVLPEELESITAKYKFISMLQAPLHGFAFWFDVEFDGPQNVPSNEHLHTLGASPETILHPNNRITKRVKSNEAIVLSTAPEDDPTHWQQTIIYFYDPIEVKQDQIIEGSITLSQSKENARFLNIRLEYSSGGRSFVKETVMR
ncbi:probable protein arginine N-methyltransferase 6 [Phalaenopsis equestris]|uniref:probable protein arginine N-methyltransferase 6 n=1 Tax=Phalaenopsis equestris TaxID=78828 RepID=UPI0009E34008|nr:probable protein arginine N-methyltransferase 6 [Phalaenopsis equestris]